MSRHGWAQHGVRVWRNDHNGGFTNISTVSTLATPPVGVTTGDFDGDGHLDLAAISEGGGYAVDWFRGNGAGGFRTCRVVPNTHSIIGRRIYTGHFTADPHLDLVAIHQTGVMVLLNDSAGTGNFNASAGVVNWPIAVFFKGVRCANAKKIYRESRDFLCETQRAIRKQIKTRKNKTDKM